MKAPASAMTPPSTQAPRMEKGVWTCRATTYGLMKIPEPTIPPITMRVASRKPRRRARRGVSRCGSAGIPLRSRAAGTILETDHELQPRPHVVHGADLGVDQATPESRLLDAIEAQVGLDAGRLLGPRDPKHPGRR